MALVKTIRNTVDMLIDDYKNKPKYILMDVDNYLRFKEELIALSLLEAPGKRVIYQSENLIYRDLKVLTVFDVKILEVVG